MFIAFEGPDETGKSISSKTLATNGEAIYNITRGEYKALAALNPSPENLVVTFDRVDWLTHMVYRLAMPNKDWNDDRIRTVFAMPETHLVLKMHHPQYVDLVHAVGEGYEDTGLGRVNELYWHQVEFLKEWNKRTEYSLFKTISVMQVINGDGIFQQQLVSFDSPNYFGVYDRNVNSDEDLLEFLRFDDSRRV